LTAIGCALPPDYSLSKNYDDEWYSSKTGADPDGPYNPQPINTSRYFFIMYIFLSWSICNKKCCVSGFTIYDQTVSHVISCPELPHIFNLFV